MHMVILLIGGLLIGVTLGLMGSGGSILTVPILVYLLDHPDKQAIAESMAVVGGIALLTVLPYAFAREVHWRSVIFFGIPGMVGAFIGASISKYIPGPVLLIFFALILFASAYLMLRRSRTAGKVKSEDSGDAPSGDTQRVFDAPTDQATTTKTLAGGESGRAPVNTASHSSPASDVDDRARNHPVRKVIRDGLLVGIITGLVGVGGGFLIVPALVLLIGLSMRLAVGTSLVIIALNGAVGFYKHSHIVADEGLSIDTWTILVFVLIGAVGSFAGRSIATRFDHEHLRRAFGYFLIVIGVVIVSTESWKMLTSGPTPAANDTTAVVQPALDLESFPPFES